MSKLNRTTKKSREFMNRTVTNIEGQPVHIGRIMAQVLVEQAAKQRTLFMWDHHKHEMVSFGPDMMDTRGLSQLFRIPHSVVVRKMKRAGIKPVAKVYTSLLGGKRGVTYVVNTGSLLWLAGQFNFAVCDEVAKQYFKVTKAATELLIKNKEVQS